ncbi:universal stress protein [Salinisphaera sp. T31B1]|uniref:universal stress protein n=1 Tax=Salinisphaera sp. T31B1 TaxID=727963 RepID=UPI00334199C1
MSQTIVVPLDLNHELVLDSVFGAVERARLDDRDRIVLLNVIPQIDVGDFPYVATDQVRALGEHAKQALADIAVRHLAPGVAWEADVRVGPVARTIVRRADYFDADLIVMASHNPAFWDVLLGSTASQVVKHARHSVLVVRQKAIADDDPARADQSRNALD